MEDSSLHLKTGTQSFVTCKIQPLIIFNILEHFSRRNEGYRVIGTLVGYNNDGVIEIKNSFPVPHTEGDQVGVDMAYHRTMLKLHHQIAPKEVIVGWYSTGNEINENSALIHDFYSQETGPSVSPIHLTVDTTLTDFQMAIKAYANVPVSLTEEKSLGFQFLPIPLEFQSFDEEKIAVDALMKGKSRENVGSMVSDLENLEGSVNKVQELLENVTGYVNTILEGKIEPDRAIGRFLADSLSALPKIEPAALERMFSNSLQDLLLVVYLSNLTRTQLALAEKLQKIV